MRAAHPRTVALAVATVAVPVAAIEQYCGPNILVVEIKTCTR